MSEIALIFALQFDWSNFEYVSFRINVHATATTLRNVAVRVALHIFFGKHSKLEHRRFIAVIGHSDKSLGGAVESDVVDDRVVVFDFLESYSLISSNGFIVSLKEFDSN